VVAYAFLNPASAFLGAWSSVEGVRVLPALSAPGADRAQVVWLGSIGDDTIGRILLDFYRAGDTMERTPQEPLDREAECALLRDAAGPVVLTDHRRLEALSRYSCVPRLSVVEVTGRKVSPAPVKGRRGAAP
jgi:hypothetical protein